LRNTGIEQWYRALASTIPDPRLIKKGIYRAAVSQRLRTTVIEDRKHRACGQHYENVVFQYVEVGIGV
jgi:hypothetical protein